MSEDVIKRVIRPQTGEDEERDLEMKRFLPWLIYSVGFSFARKTHF